MIVKKKKYIIELPENTHWIQWIMEGTKDHHPYMDYKQVEDLMPYTEPDLEQVRKEYDAFYEHGYEQGLVDAWDAARKICLNECDGGMTPTEVNRIFGVGFYRDALLEYSASEAIEKIRQYEQEKEEIQVGDEVDDGVANLIVLEINEDGTVKGFDDSGSIIHATPRKKTGRHFPEIAEVLQKMKEE